MSEVKRYHVTETGLVEGESLGRLSVVLAADFDRVTAERDAARAELALANEKIDKAWNRTTAIDHKGFIPGAMDAWKRPVPQHLPYDFSGSTSASTIQYCNGWNDSGSYWSAHAANLSKKVDALQQRLTAADERVDVLESALKFYAGREHYHFESGNWDTVSGEPLNILWNGDEPDFIEDGTVARAALKPAEAPRNQCDGCQAGIPLINGTHRMGREGGYPDFMGCSAKLYKPAEGGGDVARLALRPENQRITPARFKCLACGEYHEGSGNLPCPSMSPYSRIEQ